MRISSTGKPKTRVTSISFEEEAPRWYQRKWLWITVGFLILILAVGIFMVLNSGTSRPISPLAA